MHTSSTLNVNSESEPTFDTPVSQISHKRVTDEPFSYPKLLTKKDLECLHSGNTIPDPLVSASNWAIYDNRTGKLLFGKEEHERT